jgi:hypothetical protein
LDDNAKSYQPLTRFIATRNTRESPHQIRVAAIAPLRAASFFTKTLSRLTNYIA